MSTLLTNKLTKIGLSSNEAKVYIALLETGRTTAGPLVRKTGLHRVMVYQALETLRERRLASKIIKNNRMHFLAANPDQILENFKSKMMTAEEAVKDLKTIQNKGDTEIDVRILYGREGFISNLQTIIQSAAKFDHVIRIIGGGPDAFFYKTVGEWYQDYKNLLEHYKIKKWLLSPEKYSQEFKQKFAHEKGNILKTLPEGLTSPTYTRITPEMISIENYTDPIMIIQIKNPDIAKGYLDHFSLLWAWADHHRQ